MVSGFIFGLLVGIGLQTKSGKKLAKSVSKEADKVVAKATENITQIFKAATTEEEDGQSEDSRDFVRN